MRKKNGRDRLVLLTILLLTNCNKFMSVDDGNVNAKAMMLALLLTVAMVAS